MQTTNSKLPFEVLFKFVTKTIVLLEQGAISGTEKTANKANTRLNKAVTRIASTTQTTDIESKPPDGAVTNDAAMKPKVYIKPCLMCKGILYLGQCKQFKRLNFDQRMDIFYKNRCCYNCLLTNHRAAARCIRVEIVINVTTCCYTRMIFGIVYVT